ncbi:MAG: efflux RND transporter periplasmic adaptor subunit, partial [Actinomycetospora chiangmaiensis]|nr:efflux RND transporter periplasmic adaptor subunit [Actinomycetospora chiangmaiensis]
MRFLPSAALGVALLAAGIALGAAVPALPALLRQALAVAGLAPDSHDPAAAPDRPKAAADGLAHEDPPHGADHAAEHAEDVIRMRPDQIAGQDIATATVGGGTLARHLLVPGTITPDTDRIARVPARVVGTVAEMRKRLGDSVQANEVVAILDSREVADAKSEYLTAQVQAELQTINFERQQKLLASRSASEAAFETARAAYLETRLRVDLARQKLSALGLDAAEVAAAQKRDEATPTQSSLRRYPLRAPLAGRIVERKVDVGTAVGKEGDPADVYTVADLSTVW